MIGIKEIGTFVPAKRINNYHRMTTLNTNEAFISGKIGMEELARNEGMSVAEMCCNAFDNLTESHPVNVGDVDCIVLCTQNGDLNIPHTSAVIQSKLGVKDTCAVFDISLGCSGYVYGLSVVKSLMESCGLKNGLFFTCDPYSSVLDSTDRNTELLFGDAATVTLLQSSPVFYIGHTTFLTKGEYADALKINDQGYLSMNGRKVFEFAARNVPGNIEACIEKNKSSFDKIDAFLFHQGSKFIVDTLIKKFELPKEKVPFGCSSYGNTVSSSIPLLLKNNVSDSDKTLLLSGFGVGLGAASTMLMRY